MNSCSHIGWFYLSGRDETHIHYGNRVQYIIQEMTNADKQYPSTIFFIGSKSKDVALRQLFPHNNIRRGTHNGAVNLRLDSSTITSDFPLLFADGDPQTQIPHRLGTAACHENTTIPLSRSLTPQSSIRCLYARLVALFTDVVCIFAEDLGGLTETAKFLVNWVRFGDPSNLPRVIRPRVLIVTCEDDTATTHQVLGIDEVRFILDQEDQNLRSQVFTSINLIQLPGDHVSALAKHRRLKEVLLTEVDRSRIQRIEQRVLFSAVHMEAFFHQAFTNLAQSLDKPFDFISKSRTGNELDETYSDHVMIFANVCMENFVSMKSLSHFIASSILLDAYPPRMHGKTLYVVRSQHS